MGFFFFFGVFTSLLMFNKPKSLWASNPVTITLSHKTLFCWCSNCLTWLPGSNLCLACKSAPRMCLTITSLSTETTLWQKMYSRKEKKNSFLFFAFCKSGGSWKQPHTLIIRITTREFNLTEERERGPPRGSTKALGKTEHETSLRNPWVTGETGLWKTALVPLQTPKKGCVGRARNADEQSQVQGLISMQAEGGSQGARPVSSSCPSTDSESRLPSCSLLVWPHGFAPKEAGNENILFSPSLIFVGFTAGVYKDASFGS